MSIARHHAEWLSLIEVSGPFLSIPVLMKAFPQGLHAHESAHSQTLKLAYEEWREGANDPSLHKAWIRYVLTKTLGFEERLITEGQGIPQTLSCEIALHRQTVRPDLVINDPLSGKPRLLIMTYPASQSLSKSVQGSRWNESPGGVMCLLLRNVGLRLGLVTNGEQWMIVDAPREETSGFGSWFSQYWFEEPITLRAFRSLISAERFFGVPDEETLEALLARSADDQQEVTNQLGLQVRKAVEVLIQALDKADHDLNRSLLAGIGEKELYESAVTIMMRLVFLFCAEERDLLLLGDELYDRFYAVSTLREQLRAAADHAGEDVLERRKDAWVRLLSTFRAVHAGVRHDRLSLPAYGGHLFDPDRYPFLEGRKPGTNWRETPASPLPIHNRTVLHLLEALQTLQVRLPGGGPAESRKLSFRALGVEQIGHVYEGLLDHTAKRAPEPVLGLQGSKDKEPEIALSELERQLAKGEKEFLAYLKEETGRSEAALKKALAREPQDAEVSRLRTACQTDEVLRRVLPFANLIRLDTSDYPYVIPAGGVYVTGGTDRRSSGTHYTPPSLTEPIVQHTLEPLIYPEMADGKPQAESRRLSVEEILSLKVCDMAMGSAAFLVQAIRFLAGHIVQRWLDAEDAARARGESLPILTAPYADPATGKVTEQPIPADEEERTILAKRIVAERCIYGVDINPMAVEIAKLSIWLETMAKDRPFSFVDHALRCGDSLLGIADQRQISSFHLLPERSKELGYNFVLEDAFKVCKTTLDHALKLRRKIESFTVKTPRDAERKETLLQEAEAATSTVRMMGDLLVGAGLGVCRNSRLKLDNLIKELAEDLFFGLDDGFKEADRNKKLAELTARAQRSLISEERGTVRVRTPFHWALEFPEVFAASNPGFDAFIGNPPFVGGYKITGNLGTDYRDYVMRYLADGQRGAADLSAYFFLRAASLLKCGGSFGLLATNTIAQGDTREVGLDHLTDANPIGFSATIFRAIPSRKWPGQANLEVAEVWLRKGRWKGQYFLSERPVQKITSFLAAPGRASGTPFRLNANGRHSFEGSKVTGMGFILAPEEAKKILLRHGRCIPDPESPSSAPGTPDSAPGVLSLAPLVPSSECGSPSAKSRLRSPESRSENDACATSILGGSSPDLTAAYEPNPGESDYRLVLLPYLNGEDLNSRPDQSPSRWVINFHDWPLDRSAKGNWAETVLMAENGVASAKKRMKEWLQSGRVPADYPGPVAADYPDCLRIVEEKVKPEREKINDTGGKYLWWRFHRPRPELYGTIAGMSRVLALSHVTHHLGFDFRPANIVFAHRCVVFPIETWATFSVIQSNVHEPWARTYSSSLETRINYSPSDCFETFPFPEGLLEDGTARYPKLESFGERYHEHRRRIMLARGEGLTATYNRFHNPRDTDPAIAELRRLHAEMDRAVAAAYGWSAPGQGPNALDLGHGFHETKQGLRYTVSPQARQEILDRLLELNHARYAEEVKQGLHARRGKKATIPSTQSADATGWLPGIFDMKKQEDGG